MLQYKTRGGSSPQGKPKIYFCAHPDDFNLYFNQVAEWIHETQNCTVYYDDRKSWANEESYYFDLGQMQLFVIPITTNLLTKTNSAIEKEFPFAIENHIPVLPLMMESGLETIYKNKIGDFQFLNPNIIDETTQSFKEKFKKYLDSIIVGDELAAKIREAFDAYIFLSYRKKDRKYAQQLMKLIHANSFCRDIAIWYDEYLVPGENFNDAIAGALEKSDLFALMITPNLVNEPNYVMSVEYPKAKKVNKDILPLEMVPTSQNAMNDKYEDIRPSVNAHNPSALKKELLTAVKRLAIVSNNTDPRHIFFIGLAYLAGIDMEIDYERAVTLITSAAKANLSEAIEKLTVMYSNGEGVGKNYEVALKWQKKLVIYWREKYKEKSNSDAAISLCNSLIKYYDYCYMLCRYDDAWEAGVELCDISKEIEDLRGISIAQIELGDVCKEKEKLNDALRHYYQAMILRKKIFKMVKTEETYTKLVFIYNKLGDIYEKIENLKKAEYYYKKAFMMTDSIKDELYTSTLIKSNLLSGYSRIGKIYEKEGQLIDAQNYYGKGLVLAKELVEELNTANDRRNLSTIYEQLGDICNKNNQFDKSQEYYNYALAAQKDLFNETNSIEDRERLLISYIKTGDIYKKREILKKARGCYEKALRLSEELVEISGTKKAIRDLEVINGKLGDFYYITGNYDQAKENYAIALKISGKLAVLTGNVREQCDLATSYERMGCICEKLQEKEKAKEYYKNAYDINKKLMNEIGTVEIKDNFAANCYRLSFVSDKRMQMLLKAFNVWARLSEQYSEDTIYVKRCNLVRKELDNLKEFQIQDFQKDIALKGVLASLINTSEIWYNMSRSYRDAGNVCMRKGLFDEAEYYYHEALSLSKKIVKEINTDENQRNVVVNYYKLGEICKKKGIPKEALYFCKKSLTMCKMRFEINDTYETERDLEISYLVLGDAYMSNMCRNLESALRYYKEALVLGKRIVEKESSTNNRRDLELIFNRLGDVYRELGKLKEARTYYENGLEISKQLSKEIRTMESEDDLEFSYVRLEDICERMGLLDEAKLYGEKLNKIRK